jgi:hypothetical protein
MTNQEQTRNPQKRLRPRPPYALYGKDPVPVDGPEDIQDLRAAEQGRREEEMVEFLNNPSERTKVFLSSYLRKQGLAW